MSPGIERAFSEWLVIRGQERAGASKREVPFVGGKGEGASWNKIPFIDECLKVAGWGQGVHEFTDPRAQDLFRVADTVR